MVTLRQPRGSCVSVYILVAVAVQVLIEAPMRARSNKHG